MLSRQRGQLKSIHFSGEATPGAQQPRFHATCPRRRPSGLPYLNLLDKLVGQRNPSSYQGNVCRLIKYSDWMIKIMCKIMLGQNDLQNTYKS